MSVFILTFLSFNYQPPFTEIMGVTADLVTWVSALLSIGAGISLYFIICAIVYRLYPYIRYDDQISRIILFSRAPEMSRSRDLITALLVNRLPFIRPTFIKQFNQANNLVSSGQINKIKISQQIYKRLIDELEAIPQLSDEDRDFLSQVILKLATVKYSLGQNEQATDFYNKARTLGRRDTNLENLLANKYAQDKVSSEDAIEAYLNYLSTHRCEYDSVLRRTILQILKTVASLTDSELELLISSVSQSLTYQQIDEALVITRDAKFNNRTARLAMLNKRILNADPEIAWARLNLVHYFLFSGDAQGALYQLKKLSSTGMKVPRINYLSGLIYTMTKQYNLAIGCFVDAIKEDLLNADAYFHLARLVFDDSRSGKWTLPGEPDFSLLKPIPINTISPEALDTFYSYFYKAVSLVTDRSDYYFYAAYAAYAESKLDNAVQYLQKAIAFEPVLKEYYALLGLVQKAQNKPDEAKQSLQQVIDRSASFQPARRILGQIFFEEGNWEKAQLYSRQAIDLDKKDITSWCLYGKSAYYSGNYTVVCQLTEIIKPDDQIIQRDTDVFYCLGHSLIKADRFSEAIGYLEKLYKINHARNVTYLLGCSYAHLGQSRNNDELIEKALYWFNVSLNSNSEHAEAYLQRANLFLLKGQFAEAHADLEKSLILRNNNPDASYALGVYHHLTGDNEKALEVFRDIIALNPSHHQSILALGLISEEKNDLENALNYYLQVLPYNNTPELHLRIGAVYCKSGNGTKATENLALAQQNGAQNKELKYYQGWSHALLHDFESAYDSLVEIVDKPTLSPIAFLAAKQRFEQNDYARCINYWKSCEMDTTKQLPYQAEHVRNHLAEAYFRQAIRLLANDQPSQRIADLFGKAIHYNPQQATYRYYQALTELVCGENPETAMSKLTYLMIADEKNPRYGYQIALALMRQGQYEPSIPHFQQILATCKDTSYLANAYLMLANCYLHTDNVTQALLSLKTAIEVQKQ
jgi:tetratricopeptide (TPR) repeat protein